MGQLKLAEVRQLLCAGPFVPVQPRETEVLVEDGSSHQAEWDK